MATSNITDHDFDRILVELLDRAPASHLLAIPGIYEILSEEFNNDVLDECAAQQEEKRESARDRLEELRAELRAKRISYGELSELQSLANYIEPEDVELLEAAAEFQNTVDWLDNAVTS